MNHDTMDTGQHAITIIIKDIKTNRLIESWYNLEVDIYFDTIFGTEMLQNKESLVFIIKIY